MKTLRNVCHYAHSSHEENEAHSKSLNSQDVPGRKWWDHNQGHQGYLLDHLAHWFFLSQEATIPSGYSGIISISQTWKTNPFLVSEQRLLIFANPNTSTQVHTGAQLFQPCPSVLHYCTCWSRPVWWAALTGLHFTRPQPSCLLPYQVRCQIHSVGQLSIAHLFVK